MHIPYEMLSEDALQNLIEEFVTREGTNYGEREFSLETLVAQVMTKLRRGEAKVVFDPETESASIIPSP